MPLKLAGYDSVSWVKLLWICTVALLVRVVEELVFVVSGTVGGGHFQTFWDSDLTLFDFFWFEPEPDSKHTLNRHSLT